MTRFISIDPSSTWVGWAIFEGEGLVAWGKFDLTKVAYYDRFKSAVNELEFLRERYGFQSIAIEDVKFAWQGGGQRARNIAGMQIIFRSIFEWAKGEGILFTAHNPARWKNCVVGASHATKAITKNNIRFRFPAIPDKLSEHEYDAIGIGVYHAGLLKLEAWGGD